MTLLKNSQPFSNSELNYKMALSLQQYLLTYLKSLDFLNHNILLVPRYDRISKITTFSIGLDENCVDSSEIKNLVKKNLGIDLPSINSYYVDLTNEFLLKIKRPDYKINFRIIQAARKRWLEELLSPDVCTILQKLKLAPRISLLMKKSKFTRRYERAYFLQRIFYS